METNEKINVRGAINGLNVGDLPLELPKGEYLPSSVRSTATLVATDTGKRFAVNLDGDKIIVTRLA